ncbi:MAG: hypothetical protein D6679_09320 [Candidatus Hydrogenedentota bacterium]|nr:MAG: hypothetical protein D6679_09320 [Candidatus Hydrogenedentota bacterium]
MEGKTRDNRIFVRYKAAFGTNISLRPEGMEEFDARLLDLNKAGGFGVFIPMKNNIGNLFFSTVFLPWILIRQSRGGLIEVPTRVYNAIPTVMYNETGIRMALLHVDSRGRWMAQQGRKRRVKERLKVDSLSVELRNKEILFTGNLYDISEDDGAGIDVTPDGVGEATWNHVFNGTWKLFLMGRTFPTKIRRVSVGETSVQLGVNANGISKMIDELTAQSETDANETSKEPAKVTPSGSDDELVAFLEEFMKESGEPEKKSG